MKSDFSELVGVNCLMRAGVRDIARVIVVSEEVRLIRHKTPMFPEQHVHKRFCAMVKEHASRSAVTFQTAGGWQDWSYGELAERAKASAQGLAAAGVGHGAAVGLVAHRYPGTIAAMIGILELGAHYVPMDPAQPASRTRQFVEAAGVAQIIEASPADSRGVPYSVTSVANASTPPTPVVPPGSPEEVAYVMFTSGSTGRPKGVVIPHRGITRLVAGQDYALLDATRVILQAAPLSFDASTFEIWGALLQGGRCVLYPSGALPSAAGLRDVVSSTGVTTVWLTSALFHALVDHDVGCFEGIQELLVGGDSISPPHLSRALRRFPETSFVNGYGPTENTTFSTCYRIPADLAPTAPRVPIGRPIRGTQTAVVDEALQLVPNGTEGELVVMGEGLAIGYLGDPELTRRQFVELLCADGVRRRGYRTGDRVVEQADGVIDFLGRRDDQVKIHGYRIELQEVEAVVSSLPGVNQCRAMVQRDRSGAARVAAYVVLQGNVTLAAVRESLKSALPGYMVPHQVVALPRLPLNANGKLALDLLPPMLPSATGSTKSGHRSGHLALVEQAWTDVLGHPPETLDVNFFDAGGRSLDAVTLLGLLERRLSLSLDPTFTFEFSTPRRQATRLAELH